MREFLSRLLSAATTGVASATSISVKIAPAMELVSNQPRTSVSRVVSERTRRTAFWAKAGLPRVSPSRRRSTRSENQSLVRTFRSLLFHPQYLMEQLAREVCENRRPSTDTNTSLVFPAIMIFGLRIGIEHNERLRPTSLNASGKGRRGSKANVDAWSVDRPHPLTVDRNGDRTHEEIDRNNNPALPARLHKNPFQTG